MRTARMGRFSILAGVLLSLGSAAARAEPQLVGAGDLAPWSAPTVELKKGQCYTFILELEEGATLSPELLAGDHGIKVVAGKFSFRPLPFAFSGSQVDRMRAMAGASAGSGGAAKSSRRFVAPLTPCESQAATVKLALRDSASQRAVTEGGTGKFKLLVETRKASARDRDDGIRVVKGTIQDAQRQSNREQCDMCVRKNAGNMAGFRNCLSDYRLKASDCL
jgi:hypothetical protein